MLRADYFNSFAPAVVIYRVRDDLRRHFERLRLTEMRWRVDKYLPEADFMHTSCATIRRVALKIIPRRKLLMSLRYREMR